MKLREQAIRDPLTNLYNRRYLQESLNREIARSIRDRVPLSLIAIDLDHFKQINDVFGHDGGDLMLKTLSELIGSQMRGADIACRSGGEEFVLALPGASFTAARRRAWQLRKKFENTRVDYMGHIMQTTFSAGVASFPDHGKTIDEVLLNADLALYAAKRAGRNRVVGWQTD
jgi:diguanylate cyclase (GGDEF)-like protein